MNRRLNTILVLITLVLGSWAYYLYQSDKISDLSNLIKQDGAPEYTGNRAETTVYDLQGKPQYFASADEIKRFEGTQRTEFIKPLLNLFDGVSALKQWKVTADYAEITRDKMLHLKGNVRIESLAPNSRLEKIETDTLSVNLNTQDIFSESVVKSEGLGFTTTGNGLTGNLKKQVATLTNNVKTYIEPTVIQKSSDSKDNNSKDKE